MALKNGHLYVGSLTDNVSHLTINDTGDLTFAGCAGALSGCASLRVTAAATDPFSLALSPDGGHLYSTSTSGTLGNVAHWTLGATGNLAFVGCIGNRPGCATTTPAGALNGARGLDLSADGKHLYAAANSADAVAWMTLDGVGTPQVKGCVGQSGCTPVTPATALNGALQVSIAPDGSRLYVVSSISDAVSHLRLALDRRPELRELQRRAEWLFPDRSRHRAQRRVRGRRAAERVAPVRRGALRQCGEPLLDRAAAPASHPAGDARAPGAAGRRPGRRDRRRQGRVLRRPGLQRRATRRSGRGRSRSRATASTRTATGSRSRSRPWHQAW